MSSDPDKKDNPTESDPLLPTQAGPSTVQPQRPPLADRPKTVRHHRRTLSGRSVHSGHFQFGPSFHPNIYPAVNDPFTRQAKRAADARARSRFFKALFFGLGLWLVIGLVLGWTGWQESGWGNNNNRLNYGAKPDIPPSEGTVLACANFTSTTSLSAKDLRSTATISIQAHDFFIHTKGSFAKGRIGLGISKSDQVEVEIEALYNDEALIDLMNVCGVSRPSSALTLSHQAGLALYTPSPEVGPYPDSDLEFRLTIKLPRKLSLLEIRSPLFAVKAEDLSSIAITRLDIGTTVGFINIEKLTSHAIRIRTENGHVDGFFNVSKTLSLATTNGAINAQVALFPPVKGDNDLPALPPNPPSRGSLSAANSSNFSTSVHATTTNGGVVLQYVEHPVDQTLLSFVSSTNGKASVDHPPSFEGDFEAETTWGSAMVKGPLSQNDPKGLGRQRKKVTRTDRDELGYRHLSGSVWWAEKDGKRGNERPKGGSVVKTTLGSALIIFN